MNLPDPIDADAAIRARVLQALSLNRTPGYHFPAHLLQLSFDNVARERTAISLDPGAHCLDATGEVHIGAVALLIDLSMSASIRAGMHPAQRLGTVNMTIQFTRAPRIGRLESEAVFQNFLEGATGQQGVSRYTLRSDGEAIATGSGAFMVLDPPKGVTIHPVSHRRRGDPLPESLDAANFRDDELKAGLDYLSAEPLRAYEERRVKESKESKESKDAKNKPKAPKKDDAPKEGEGMMAGVMAPGGAEAKDKKEMLPVTPLGRYLKVLLSSSEFLFVD